MLPTGCCIQKKSLLAAIYLVASLSGTGPCSAAAVHATSSPQSIESLTDELLGKEVELMRLQTNLLLHTFPKHGWTERRWLFYSLSNMVLTSVGAFIDASGRFSYLHRNRIARAPRYLFDDGAWCRILANYISVGGSAIEFFADRWADHRSVKEGVDLKTMRRYFEGLRHDIAALATQRAKLIENAQLSSGQRYRMQLESSVLSDLDQQATSQFVRAYAGAKGERVSRDINLLLTGASNFNAGAGAMVGVIANNLNHGTARWRTRLSGTGGICDIVSGSVNFSVPLFMRAGANAESLLAARSLFRSIDFERKPILNWQDPLSNYEQLKETDESIAAKMSKRRATFQMLGAILTEQDAMWERRYQRRWQRLREQMIPATSNGSTKTTHGITSVIAAFDLTAKNKVQQRFRIVGAGNMAYGAGYALGSTEVIRYETRTELRQYRERKAGTSPRQIFTKELTSLSSTY